MRRIHTSLFLMGALTVSGCAGADPTLQSLPVDDSGIVIDAGLDVVNHISADAAQEQDVANFTDATPIVETSTVVDAALVIIDATSIVDIDAGTVSPIDSGLPYNDDGEVVDSSNDDVNIIPILDAYIEADASDGGSVSEPCYYAGYMLHSACGGGEACLPPHVQEDGCSSGTSCQLSCDGNSYCLGPLQTGFPFPYVPCDCDGPDNGNGPADGPCNVCTTLCGGRVQCLPVNSLGTTLNDEGCALGSPYSECHSECGIDNGIPQCMLPSVNGASLQADGCYSGTSCQQLPCGGQEGCWGELTTYGCPEGYGFTMCATDPDGGVIGCQ